MKRSFLIIAASVAVLTTTLALSQSRPTPDQDAITLRRAIMNVMQGITVPMNLMARGRTPWDAAYVKRTADRLVVLSGMVAEAFERDTSAAANTQTEALPIVWKDHADFVAHLNDLQTKAQALAAAAAKSGNDAATKTAISDAAATCGACHDKFRQSTP